MTSPAARQGRRLTALLLERLPRGRVTAVDKSDAMLPRARVNLAEYAERVIYLRADLPVEVASTLDKSTTR